MRILSADLTDYELMACHWGYAYNSKFEDIRVLHHGEHEIPDLLGHNYWIVADQHVMRMDYDPGRRD